VEAEEELYMGIRPEVVNGIAWTHLGGVFPTEKVWWPVSHI
jgi:hypothetical protein